MARCEGVERIIPCDLRRWRRQILSPETRAAWRAFRADLRAGVRNAEVREADGAQGCAGEGPFDVIVLSGSVPQVPQALLSQLKIGGRRGVIVGDSPVMSAQVITRVSESAFNTLRLFETDVPPLRNAVRPSTFRF